MLVFEINKESLLSLSEGLRLIERLDAERVAEMGLHLYGITADPRTLSEVKAAIIDEAEPYYDEDGDTTLSEEDVGLNEVGVAIPLSSDAIYALSGPGIQLKGLTFAYIAGEGEGARTLTIFNSQFSSSRIALNSLTKMALAKDDTDLDEFLVQNGSMQALSIAKPPVPRTQPAAVPSRKVAPPASPGVPETAYDDEFKKSMGIQGSMRDLIEGFLDRN